MINTIGIACSVKSKKLHPSMNWAFIFIFQVIVTCLDWFLLYQKLMSVGYFLVPVFLAFLTYQFDALVRTVLVFMYKIVQVYVGETSLRIAIYLYFVQLNIIINSTVRG